MRSRLLGIQGKRSVDSIHKELGHILWEHVGMGRTKEGLEEGLKKMKAKRPKLIMQTRMTPLFLIVPNAAITFLIFILFLFSYY